MNVAEYKKLEELGEIEWVQHRPETFIGTTDNPTHLFEEVFDNALDEVLAGYAKNITIKIDKGSCLIQDDGRGFPVTNNKDGIAYPVRACTKLYTSGKFNKSTNAYEMSAGLNGIGLVAVCVLSDSMEIITHRNGKAHKYQFTTSFRTHKVKSDIIKPTKSDGKGTMISFKPSNNIFRSVIFDKEYIIERVKLAKTLTTAKINLFIDDKPIDIKVDKSKLVDGFFDNKDDNETYKVTVKSQNQIFNVYFFYDMVKNEPRFKGSINLLPVHSGSHIKYAKHIISSTLMSCMPKNKTLAKSDYVIGIRCFVECNIKEPRFSGQTKESLNVDLKRFSIFEKQLITGLTKIFKTDMDLKTLYQRFLTYKQGLNVKKATKKAKVRKFSANLTDSASYGKGTFLFIVEGDSAAGSLVQCRDVKKHAIFKLLGKSMPNVEATGVRAAAKILGNKTVIDLFNALDKDLTMEPIDSIDKIRYEYIVITTDPDIDGYHITVMMMKFFNKFFPQLIDEGRLLLAQVPLYGYTDKKKFIPIFDNDEAMRLMESGKSLNRHKGLGEFDPSELRTVLFEVGNYIALTKKKIEEVIEESKDIIENLDIINDEPKLSEILSKNNQKDSEDISNNIKVESNKDDDVNNSKDNIQDEDIPTINDFLF